MNIIIIEDLNSIAKNLINTISKKIFGKVVDSAKDFIIKLSLFIVILISSIIFTLFGFVKTLSKIDIFESGILFLVIGIALFASSFVILKSIYE